MTFLANGIEVLTGRVLIPWGGAWSAVLELDAPAALPDGPVALVNAAGASAIGWVDPESSGKFGERVTVGVIGGRGGWRKDVGEQHFRLPVGVPLALVVSTTAAEVLEAAVVASGEVLGEDYVRAAGPASSVLDGRAWHVRLDGTTVVGPRVPVPASPDVSVLSYDVETSVAVLSSDGFVIPGTILVDELLGGTKVVRDVEVVISAKSMEVRASLADAAPEGAASLRLVDELASLARAAVRAEWCRVYEYRVIAHDGGPKVEIQRDGEGPMPDLLPCPIWHGVPGVKATLSPSAHVLVGFVSGQPSRPAVVGYQGQGDGVPLRLAIDAQVDLSLCTGGAPGVPIALAPAVAAFASAVQMAVAAAASSAGPGPVNGGHLAAMASAIATAVAALTAPGALASLKVRGT